jgi:surface protein
MSGLMSNTGSPETYANFDEDISGWDTSMVTQMQYMFHHASSFNQDITGWDTGSCTMMEGMFQNAAAFQQDVSTWDVSLVTGMNYMFLSATAFSQDLSTWCAQNIDGAGPTSFGNSGGTPPTWGGGESPAICPAACAVGADGSACQNSGTPTGSFRSGVAGDDVADNCSCDCPGESARDLSPTNCRPTNLPPPSLPS